MQNRGQNCWQKRKGATETEICLVGVGVAREVHAAARSVEGPLLQRREISIGLSNTINAINKYREDVGLGVGVDAAADVRRLSLRDAVDGLLVVQAHRLVCKERASLPPGNPPLLHPTEVKSVQTWQSNHGGTG